MLSLTQTEFKKERKLGVAWGVTFMIIFPLLITLGLIMRLKQGDVTGTTPEHFYAIMTLHGLGMASILFSFSMAGLWYLLSTRYVRLKTSIAYFVYFSVVIGLLGLAVGTLIMKYGPGWYMLYPLPFVGTFWSSTATLVSVLSLIVLGVAWLVGIVHILFALAVKYGGFDNLFGWQYLKKGQNHYEIKPVIMITAISLVPALLGYIVGAAMLIMYLLQVFEPTLTFNPLLMKNMVMFFGHLLVNCTMYCCVGWVYELMPEFTHHEWKTNKILVYSWNVTFICILFAYFHHLYMDFAQPESVQVLGQIISYLSAVPATGVTMFSMISQVYHSKIRWSIVPLLFLVGMGGWALGGFAAVVDSTIAFNSILHNTLWVPGHFHSYMLLGVVLFVLGFLFYLFSNKETLFPKPDQKRVDAFAKIGFLTFVVGGLGFVMMFFLGGMNSVPRRYSTYTGIHIEHVKDTGILLARIASVFIGVLLIGLSIIYISLFKRLLKRQPLHPTMKTKVGDEEVLLNQEAL